MEKQMIGSEFPKSHYICIFSKTLTNFTIISFLNSILFLSFAYSFTAGISHFLWSQGCAIYSNKAQKQKPKKQKQHDVECLGALTRALHAVGARAVPGLTHHCFV